MLSFRYWRRSRDSGLQDTNCLIILSLLPWLPTPTYVSTPCIRCCDHNPVRNTIIAVCVIQFCSSRRHWKEVETLSFCFCRRSWDSGLQYTNCLIILSLLPWLPTPTYVSTPCIPCCDHNPVRNTIIAVCVIQFRSLRSHWKEVEMLSFCFCRRSWDSGLQYTNCLLILSLLPIVNSCLPCLWYSIKFGLGQVELHPRSSFICLVFVDPFY